PRHSRRTRDASMPSTSSRPSAVNSSWRIGRRHSRWVSHAPCTKAAATISQAAPAGSSLAATATGPSRARSTRAPASQREGRQSMRQGADPPDERFEGGIIRAFVAEEPFPEPIVLGVQQPEEDLAFGRRGLPPSLLQPALEQAVE